MKSGTLVLLRIPFFFFLAPVFLAAAAVAPSPDLLRSLWAFFVIHFLLYPASNSFNSYYDKDRESIGGIENPPLATPGLLKVSLSLDCAAVVCGLLISPLFSIMLFLYGLFSKAYSWEKTRWKKYPVFSWILVGFGCGLTGFVMSLIAVQPGMTLARIFSSLQFAGPAVLCMIFLLGSYPLTQIYQHREDRRRGDLTLSRILGIRGTFVISGLFFLCAIAGFSFYFFRYSGRNWGLFFPLLLVPAACAFGIWGLRCFRDESNAGFRQAMAMNWISSAGLNVFFLAKIFMRK